MHVAHTMAGSARIGPNAIIQTVAALQEQYGQPEAQTILRRIGRGELVSALPSSMIDEQEFISMIGALRADLGLEAAGRILARSGERTADYVRQNRIPAPARTLLSLLPRRLGLRVLLKAISGHAWTFAGSGRFSYEVGGRGAILQLADCAECRGLVANEPLCSYYTACFQALLRPLIDRRLTVRETACAATGAEACVFEVVLP